MAVLRRRLRCERLAAFGLLAVAACGSTGGSPPGTAGTSGGAGSAGKGAAGSGTGGDAQRLPNGNILATDSDAKHIDELDPSGHVVATFVASQYLGYAEFRESLYGPPRY
jgi:hypothetical protein